MSNGDVSVLVVGVGSIGRRHLRNLKALGVRRLSVLRVLGKGLADPSLLDGVVLHRSLDAALDAAPDAVVVCNPTSLHVPVALEAARRNCHLFIEKPLSDSLSLIADLEIEARERALTVAVGYHLRHHPALTFIRQWVEQDAIGKIISIRAEVGQYLPDWHPSEDYRAGYSARRDLGGGVLLDLSHEIDYVLWLAGAPGRLCCIAGRYSSLEIDTEDAAEITMECSRVPLVSLHLDYVQRQVVRRCHITGERGSIRWDDGAGEVALLRAETGSWKTLRSAPDRNDIFIAEMRHFLACVQGRAAPLAGLAEGRAALMVALAARRSSGERRFVELREEGQAKG